MSQASPPSVGFENVKDALDYPSMVQEAIASLDGGQTDCTNLNILVSLKILAYLFETWLMFLINIYKADHIFLLKYCDPSPTQPPCSVNKHYLGMGWKKAMLRIKPTFVKKYYDLY